MQSTPPRFYHFHTILDRRSLSPKNKCANSQRDCNLISMTVIGIKAMQYKNHHIYPFHRLIRNSSWPVENRTVWWWIYIMHTTDIFKRWPALLSSVFTHKYKIEPSKRKIFIRFGVFTLVSCNNKTMQKTLNKT